MDATPHATLWAVAGLGNPGSRYEGTRHNVGAEAVARLAARFGVSFAEKDEVLFARAGDPPKALLLIPRVFMNDCGRVLAPFLRNRNLPPSRLLAVTDDFDLPCGRLRLRPGGGSAGHHGMDSLIAHLGTPDFPRLRLGVGKPPSAEEGAGHVLGRFRPEEREKIEAALSRAVDALFCVLEEGLATAMNRFNAPRPEDVEGERGAAE